MQQHSLHIPQGFMSFYSFALLFFFVFTSSALPRPDYSRRPSQVDYLVKFNYMGANNPDPQMSSTASEATMTIALRRFQKFAGLPVTGIMDKATQEKMAAPRCGNPDPQPVPKSKGRKRTRRYVLKGGTWPLGGDRTLTYRCTRFTPDMPQQAAQSAIDRAFLVWSAVANVNFRRIDSGDPDIELFFARGDHGDGNPFDGRGSTLAHAYFPSYGGDVHFDEDEYWTVGSTAGINLFQVAAHEIGHSLGLGHSDDNSALMAPFYRGYESGFSLPSDDIAGVRRLYGDRSAVVPTSRSTTRTTSSTTTRRPSGGNDLCSDPSIDAFIKDANMWFAFRGNEVMQILNTPHVHVGYGYPRAIRDLFPGISGPIDAGYADYSFYYLFKNLLVYVYNKSFILQRITNINQEFPGLNGRVNAVVIWSGNQLVYFFTGNEYYRMSNLQSKNMDSGYPMQTSVWNIPSNAVTASVQFTVSTGQTFTYLFYGRQYYRYDDQQERAILYPYPRDVGRWWFRCGVDSTAADIDEE